MGEPGKDIRPTPVRLDDYMSANLRVHCMNMGHNDPAHCVIAMQFDARFAVLHPLHSERLSPWVKPSHVHWRSAESDQVYHASTAHATVRRMATCNAWMQNTLQCMADAMRDWKSKRVGQVWKGICMHRLEGQVFTTKQD